MNTAAQVAKVSGPAFVVRDGQETALAQGMDLLVSDEVRTGMDANCEFRFADGTEVALGPMSSVRLEDFAYNPGAPAAEQSFAMHMMEGLVRTVSGEVVKLNPEGFSLSTPLGTAGIRGTTIVAKVFPTHAVLVVTEMGAGHSVYISSIFGGELSIHQPGKGAVLSLDGGRPIESLDFLPEDLREIVVSAFEGESGPESHSDIILQGDTDFLAVLGAIPIGEGVGVLPQENLDILIAMLEELGVAEVEYILEGPPEGPGKTDYGPLPYLTLTGDSSDNLLLGSPASDHLVYGYQGNDSIAVFGGNDTVYGGNGSQDLIVKLGLMADGSALYGGEESLSVTALDNDTIIVRGYDLVTDTGAAEYFDLAVTQPLGGMSGGEIIGGARQVDNVTGGATSISLYGDMTGGAIYGKAETASNSSFSNGAVTVSGLMNGGALYGDAATLANSTAGSDSFSIGSLADGAVIYGDAAFMDDGKAGNDFFSIGAITGGVIYGDAASYANVNNSSYGSNEFVIGSMSGGSLYAGNGADQVSISTNWTGGLIDLGNGDDTLIVSGSAGDVTLNAGRGSKEVSIDSLTGVLSASAEQGGSVFFTFGSIGAGALLDFSGAGSYKTNAIPAGSALQLGDGAMAFEILDGMKNGGSLGLGSSGSKDIILGSNATLADTVMAAGALIDGTGNNDDQTIALWGALSSGTISLGGGGDSVSILGNMGGGTTISLGGGNDTLTVASTSSTSATNIVYGDDVSLNGVSGGNDAMTISGGGTIYGDAKTLTNCAGGADKITINRSMLLRLYGDGESLVNSSGGNDIISVTGTMNNDYIYGDAEILNSSAGGDDNIFVELMTVGSHVFGDGLNMTGSGVRCGNDEINVATLASGHVFGDLYTMHSGVVGGNDSISITLMDGSSSGGLTVSGEGSTLTDSTGGADKITIDTLNIGSVHGDAMTVTNSACGNDTITIGKMGGGASTLVYGDGSSLTDSTGGEDRISIDTLSSGYVYGDAKTVTDSTCGDDIFIIGTMQDGTVYGDCETIVGAVINGSNSFYLTNMSGGSILAGKGNDAVTVSGLLSGGTLDTGDGADTVSIDSFQSAGNAVISTGTGNDSVSIITWTGTGGSLSLGPGNDTLTLRYVYNEHTIDMGGGTDRLNLNKFAGFFAELGYPAGTVTITVKNWENGSTISVTPGQEWIQTPYTTGNILEFSYYNDNSYKVHFAFFADDVTPNNALNIV